MITGERKPESTVEATLEVSETPETTIGLRPDGEGRKLFPEYFTEPKEQAPEEATPAVEGSVEVTGEAPTIETEKVAEEPSKEPASTEPEYLSPEDFGDKQFKLLIDGKEEVVTFKDAVRRIQTDKSLTQKGQKIAEEFRQLQALKNTQPKPGEVIAPRDDVVVDEYAEQPSADMRAMQTQVDSLTKIVSGLNSTLAPTVYDQELKRVDTYLKSKGRDDFMKYVPEVEKHVISLPVEEQASITADGYIRIYQDLKIKELEAKATQPPEPTKGENRPTPKVVKVEGGGSPAGADDAQSQYRAAFKKAQQSEKMADWAEVTRIKREMAERSGAAGSG